jgi:hypothetical protein
MDVLCKLAVLAGAVRIRRGLRLQRYQMRASSDEGRKRHLAFRNLVPICRSDDASHLPLNIGDNVRASAPVLHHPSDRPIVSNRCCDKH